LSVIPAGTRINVNLTCSKTSSSETHRSDNNTVMLLTHILLLVRGLEL